MKGYGRLFLVLLVWLALVGCARAEVGETPAVTAVTLVRTAGLVTATATATLTPRPSATATLTPTAVPSATATKTPWPTRTPTATATPAVWVDAGTRVAGAGAVISAENATALTELARWGLGVITDIDLSEDGRWLAVAAGSTVSIH